MIECATCHGSGWARDLRRPDLAAAIALVELQLLDLDARTADLKQRLAQLRGLLT
jgi:hypothetical protein